MKFTTMTAAVKPASGTATRRTDPDRRPARNPVASSSTVNSVCSHGKDASVLRLKFGG